jgi:hypothetical protein
MSADIRQQLVWFMTSGFPIPFRAARMIRGGRHRSYVIGSMFTASYSCKAERLAASCEKLGLPYLLHEVPTVHRSISKFGTEDPAYTKANYIYHLLAELRKPVLYVDADAEFESQPTLIDELVSSGCDFAVYNLLADEYTDMFAPIEITLRPDEPPTRNRFYIRSGSMEAYSDSQLMCYGFVQFYRCSPAARNILSRWHKTVVTFRGCADDPCLDFTFNNLTRRSWLYWLLKVRWLPKSYARVPWWIYAKPVINHPDPCEVGDGHRRIIDPEGRKQHYPALMKRRESHLFPKDCVIDTEQNLVCKLVDGQVVPIGPINQIFWP